MDEVCRIKRWPTLLRMAQAASSVECRDFDDFFVESKQQETANVEDRSRDQLILWYFKNTGLHKIRDPLHFVYPENMLKLDGRLLPPLVFFNDGRGWFKKAGQLLMTCEWQYDLSRQLCIADGPFRLDELGELDDEELERIQHNFERSFGSALSDIPVYA